MRNRLFVPVVIALSVSSCGDATSGSTSCSGNCSVTISLGLAVADFTGAGRADLAIPYTVLPVLPPEAPNHISVYLQQSGGSTVLGPPSSYTVGLDTWNTIAADVNGDGLPDIVTVDNTSRTLSLLLNDSSQPGHFHAATTIASGTDPQEVVAADVDQDGHLDLIESDSGGIMIHLQDPTTAGAFRSATSIAIGSPCCAGVAVGDLNGDGLPDIVVATQGTALRILFQDPGSRGTFLAPVAPIPGTTGNNVVIADLDGDGTNDLVYDGVATASGPSSGIAVALGDHAHPGLFLPPTTYASAWGGVILVQDINGDGLPDLIVGSGSGVSVLLQDRAHPGQFLAAQTYGSSCACRYIALGDVNGDGLPDIIVNTGPSFGTAPGVLLQLPGHAGQFGPCQDLH